MFKIDSFAVIGGDLRQAWAAELLTRDGYPVRAVGFDRDIELPRTIKKVRSAAEAISESKYILLPLPLSGDGVYINAPYSSNAITLSEVLGAVDAEHILLAGRVSDDIAAKASEMGLNLIDYFEREELAVRNAVPTAEGAIQLCMEELPVTLHGARCLVVGFGRIGKVLAADLAALGASVTVAARKCSDLAWIQTLGYKHIRTARLSEASAHADVIFNTVPALLFDEEILLGIPKETLLIDLASKPGGVDFEAAGRLGLKTIWALSLPGKVAPVTSGAIIKDTVMNILGEVSS